MECGELALTLPIGLVRDLASVVVKDPDVEVQERLELLCDLPQAAQRRQSHASVNRSRARPAAARSALGAGNDGRRCNCLWEISIEMMPEDGVLAVYGIGEDCLPAFTDDGIKNLRELVRIYKNTEGWLSDNQTSQTEAGC